MFKRKQKARLAPSYTGGEVVALISIVENFGEIQAIVMKLGEFS